MSPLAVVVARAQEMYESLVRGLLDKGGASSTTKEKK